MFPLRKPRNNTLSIGYQTKLQPLFPKQELALRATLCLAHLEADTWHRAWASLCTKTAEPGHGMSFGRKKGKTMAKFWETWKNQMVWNFVLHTNLRCALSHAFCCRRQPSNRLVVSVFVHVPVGQTEMMWQISRCSWQI